MYLNTLILNLGCFNCLRFYLFLCVVSNARAHGNEFKKCRRQEFYPIWLTQNPDDMIGFFVKSFLKWPVQHFRRSVKFLRRNQTPDYAADHSNPGNPNTLTLTPVTCRAYTNTNIPPRTSTALVGSQGGGVTGWVPCRRGGGG